MRESSTHTESSSAASIAPAASFSVSFTGFSFSPRAPSSLVISSAPSPAPITKRLYFCSECLAKPFPVRRPCGSIKEKRMKRNVTGLVPSLIRRFAALRLHKKMRRLANQDEEKARRNHLNKAAKARKHALNFASRREGLQNELHKVLRAILDSAPASAVSPGGWQLAIFAEFDATRVASSRFHSK